MTRLCYPAYKPSGVPWLGDVPAHWEVKRLRFAAKLNPVKSEINDLADDTVVSFVPMEAVGEYGGMSLEVEKTIAEVKAGYTYFADGDVVLAKITPCFENGKGALVAGLTNGIAFGTTELHVVRSRKRQLDRRFLFYLTIAEPFRKIGEAMMFGAGGQKRVPEDFIKDFRPGLPPLPEQTAIAAFLDRETTRLDSLIGKRQRFIELLQEKRAALISQAVTRGLNPSAPLKDSGIEWLGRVPQHWEIKRLAMVSESIQTGPFGSQLHASDYVDEGTPVINPANIVNGKIVADYRCSIDDEKLRDLARHTLMQGDIVFGRRGEMGRCGLVGEIEDGWLCGTGCLRVRPNHNLVDPTFLNTFFGLRGVSEYLSLVSVGSTMENLNTSILGRIPVLVPPFTEQHFIAAYLDRETARLDALRGKVEAAIEKLKEYRAALIAAAVTGKIDVRGAA